MTDNKKHEMSRSIMYDMQSIDYNSKWKNNLNNKTKYDNVFINFSLKHIMANPNLMMENLLDLTKSDSKVLVVFLDGDVIENILGSRDRFEIKDDNNKTIIGLYRYDDTYDSNGSKIKQIIIYVRGTLRFGTGSVEYIVHSKDLQTMFELNGYSVIESDSFANKQEKYINNDDHIKSNKDKQTILEVLGWFRYILFKRD